MAPSTSVKLELPSEIKLIDLVHSATEKMAEFAGLDEDEALNVGLAVREAVINAMLHGNQEQSQLPVNISLTVDQGLLKAVITDEGAGFDPAGTADPTAGENLMRDSGRGLLLMEAFVDSIEFRRRSNGGMEVELTKSLPSANVNGDESP
jgi:serine/threonine-protein kinase RsbW